MKLWKNHDFVLVFAGWNISLLGTLLQASGFSFYVLLSTGSAVQFSITLGIEILPGILFAPLSGFSADRFSRKRMAVLCDLMSALIVTGVLAAFLIRGSVSVPLIYLAVFLLSSVNTFCEPVQSCLIQCILPQEDYARAKSLSAAVRNGISILSPALAGVLFGLSGLRVILLFNLASFLCSALLESMLRSGASPLLPEKPGFFSSFREGLRYIRSEPFILSFLLILCTLNFIAPAVTVGTPVIARMILRMNAAGIGFASSWISAGFLVGSVLTGVFSKRLSRIPFRFLLLLCTASVMLSLFLTGGWLLILAVRLSFAANLCLLFLFDVIMIIPCAVVQIRLSAEFQRVVPGEIMGRTVALVNAFLTGSLPLGQLAVGVMMSRLPYFLVFFAGALLALLLLIRIRFESKRAVA